jgi:hypothetical protein
LRLKIDLTPLCGAHPQDPVTLQQWEPVPPKVLPGADFSAAPSDAIVLFDGRNLDEWVMTNDRSPARWRVEKGALVVDKSVGNIETKASVQKLSAAS